MLSNLLKEITLWFGSLGYWGVFLACLGLFPAEIVIAMVGAAMPQNILQIAIAAALGEMIGAYPTYLVGYYFRNKNILRFLTEGKGRFLNISEKSYNSGYKSVRKGGAFYVLFSRLVPWLRVVIGLIAGYVKFTIVLFSLAVFTGTLIYAYTFAYMGAAIGFNWSKIKGVIDTFNNVSTALIVIGILIYIYSNRKKFSKEKKDQS